MYPGVSKLENKLRRCFVRQHASDEEIPETMGTSFFKEYERPVMKATFWAKIMSTEIIRDGRIILYDFVGSWI